MGERIMWGDIIGQIVGGIVVASIVTAASYIWRLPQAQGPKAVFIVYIVSAILLFVSAFVIFRRNIRRAYERNRRLTPLPSFLQFLIWGLFFAFPCIYNSPNWAWSRSYFSQTRPILGAIGWACVGIGLTVLIGAIAWLGLPRSFGQKGKELELTGPYRVTRNPQLMGGALLIIGYLVLWPSWYALGWLVLFAAMTHMMVLTEEEHLRRIHSEDYEKYCKQVPRYLGFPRKS